MGFLSFLIRLDGDNRGFKNMMDESAKAGQSLFDRLKAQSGQWAQSLGASALGIKLLRSEWAQFNEEIEKSKDIKFGAERLGTDWQNFQKLQIQADKSRTSIDAVTSAVEKLGVAQAQILSKSNEGGQGMGGELGKYAEIIGLRKDDLTKNPLSNLERLKARYSGQVMTPEQRVAMRKLFGKGSGELIPFMESKSGPSDFFSMKDDATIAEELVAGSDKTAWKNLLLGGRRHVLEGKGPGDEMHATTWMGHKYGNMARWLTGTPYKDLKSPKEAMAEARKKAADHVREESNEFKKLLELEEREAEAAERAKEAKKAELEAVKEIKRNSELREKAYMGGKNNQEQVQEYKNRISAAESQVTALLMAGKGSDPDVLKNENDIMEWREKIASLSNTKQHGYSPTALERQGGFIGSRQDPLIDVNRQQLQELREINQSMKRLRAVDTSTRTGIPDTAFPV